MRLKDFEKKSIVNEILKIDPDAEIYLCGSRVNDEASGGDIDIVIKSDTIDLSSKIKIKKNLFKNIGEQKIDLVITKDGNDPFSNLMLEQGIKLN